MKMVIVEKTKQFKMSMCSLPVGQVVIPCHKDQVQRDCGKHLCFIFFFLWQIDDSNENDKYTWTDIFITG